MFVHDDDEEAEKCKREGEKRDVCIHAQQQQQQQ